jgi:hypothetical protein
MVWKVDVPHVAPLFSDCPAPPAAVTQETQHTSVRMSWNEIRPLIYCACIVHIMGRPDRRNMHVSG